MSVPFVIAVPAKGRLQANAEAFFARAGLELVKPRGGARLSRHHRRPAGCRGGLSLGRRDRRPTGARWGASRPHRRGPRARGDPDADERVVLIDGLGFGHANVVVAVPQAWIDVHSMADLDDVATAFRLRHERKMRLTKYVNLTRAFFSTHGITDYRIVESAGTRPRRAGGRHCRAHRRHHHDGCHARRQRPEGDRGRRDPALAGQSGGGARRAGARANEIRRSHLLDRIAAQRARGRAFREVRTRWRLRRGAALRGEAAFRRRGAWAGRPPPACSRCTARPSTCRRWRRCCATGAENVVVADLGHVFSRANPLYAKLEAGLG